MKKYLLGKSKEDALALFPNSVIKRVEVGGKIVGVLRIGEDFYAYDELCPHRQASLLHASINGKRELVCPLHHYRFELSTGNVKSGFCPKLQVYETKITQKGLEIILLEEEI